MASNENFRPIVNHENINTGRLYISLSLSLPYFQTTKHIGKIVIGDDA